MFSLKKALHAAAITLALATLASCANADPDVTVPAEQNQTTPAEVSAESTPAPDTGETTTGVEFPDADYGGDVFRVYIRINTYYSGDYIYAESENGDVMNDSVFRRNTRVEEKYKIRIDARKAPNPYTTLDKDVSSGSADYDLILDRRSDLATTSVAGLLYDFNSVDIDYSRPWWDNNSQGYAINGRLFLMANDIDTGIISGARFYYFNKALIDSFHLDNPYDLVASNEWTLDKFLTLVKSAHEDGTAGGLGIYGLLRETGSSNGNHMHLLVGCGVKSSTTTSEGVLQQAIGDQIEKISDIFERLTTVLKDPSLALTFEEVETRFTGGTYPSRYDRGRAAFAAGHFLFVQNGLDVSVQFSDMPEGYGVVPNPKYDKDQENYYHKIDRFSAIWAIPNTPDRIDFDRLAKVFDYWAYVSSETVMPAYYEITIKTRRFSDPVASDMIDIVKSSLVYDACDVYGITINSTLDTVFNSGNVASVINSGYLKTISASIRNIESSIDKKYTG